jgi:superfamily II DNA/RNA helicase
VVNADIAQFVEIRPEADRFLRLLEILGEWYEVGKIIIFVHTQDNCDNLFRDLLKVGAVLSYGCMPCRFCACEDASCKESTRAARALFRRRM